MTSDMTLWAVVANANSTVAATPSYSQPYQDRISDRLILPIPSHRQNLDSAHLEKCSQRYAWDTELWELALDDVFLQVRHCTGDSSAASRSRLVDG
ncbi:hypothetical protein NMY22_g7839 [Coprinellus aureogranulatus]|nr:hypothetical protein NMY22_g7839 [Coprinellus aureogranulatus]